MDDIKTYTLIGADGKPYKSIAPGLFGGHKRLKIYGLLDCPATLRHIAKDEYVKHRVFFEDEDTAVKAGYRPCGVCMKEAYKKWKAKYENEYVILALHVNQLNASGGYLLDYAQGESEVCKSVLDFLSYIVDSIINGPIDENGEECMTAGELDFVNKYNEILHKGQEVEMHDLFELELNDETVFDIDLGVEYSRRYYTACQVCRFLTLGWPPFYY